MKWLSHAISFGILKVKNSYIVPLTELAVKHYSCFVNSKMQTLHWLNLPCTVEYWTLHLNIIFML